MATRSMSDGHESGDLLVIHEFPEGLLMAVIDGLGHGEQAALASRRCASLLAEYAGEPLDVTVARCHDRLHGMRGVALSVCILREKASAWSWIGVGNVSGVLIRSPHTSRREREILIQRNGVVGAHMPKVSVSTVPASPGDVMTLATDGIRTDYSYAVDLSGTPQQVADRIMDEYATGKDDALAFVARYAGRQP